MGWKDGCPSCGGHPNTKGVLLHRPNCLVNDDAGCPWAAPVLAQRDSFYIGLIHTLVVHELFIAYSNHKADIETIRVVLSIVLSRFPDAEVSAEVHDTILNRVEREVIHGGSDIPTP